MLEHLPLKVLKDVASNNISKEDLKIVDKVSKHNHQLIFVSKNSSLI